MQVAEVDFGVLGTFIQAVAAEDAGICHDLGLLVFDRDSLHCAYPDTAVTVAAFGGFEINYFHVYVPHLILWIFIYVKSILA